MKNTMRNAKNTMCDTNFSLSFDPPMALAQKKVYTHSKVYMHSILFFADFVKFMGSVGFFIKTQHALGIAFFLEVLSIGISLGFQKCQEKQLCKMSQHKKRH